MKEWFKARNIWGAAIQALPDEAAGRLCKAIWAYTMDGELVPLDGAENGIFSMILMTLKQDEVRDFQISEKRAISGAMGGRQKVANATACYQMPANATKCQQMSANEASATNKNKNKNKNEEQEKEAESEFILDDAAIQIQREHDSILEAAQNAGFKGSASERAGLLNLYATYGLEKMLAGIESCVKHSAPNLAYLEAVLKGNGKKEKASAKDIHGYEQRDYSGEQAEALRRMMEDDWEENAK